MTFGSVSCDLPVTVRRTLGPWQQGPCMEIPFLPSMSSQRLRPDLAGSGKVGWSPGLIRVCLAAEFFGSWLFVAAVGFLSFLFVLKSFVWFSSWSLIKLSPPWMSWFSSESSKVSAEWFGTEFSRLLTELSLLLSSEPCCFGSGCF